MKSGEKSKKDRRTKLNFFIARPKIRAIQVTRTMASEQYQEAIQNDLEDGHTVAPPVMVSAIDLDTQTGLNSPPLKRPRISVPNDENDPEAVYEDELAGEDEDEWEDEDSEEEAVSPESLILDLFHAESIRENNGDGIFLLEISF